ncbi:MAG TPA: hypothetical protein VIK39_09080 [Candidatus Angelobacter sp.]
MKPASLKALPKSLSFGKSEWQVAHEVWYCREKAGIAWLAVERVKKSKKQMHATPYCVRRENILIKAP